MTNETNKPDPKEMGLKPEETEIKAEQRPTDADIEQKVDQLMNLKKQANDYEGDAEGNLEYEPMQRADSYGRAITDIKEWAKDVNEENAKNWFWNRKKEFPGWTKEDFQKLLDRFDSLTKNE